MTGLLIPKIALPPCLASFVPFMISILGCSWLPLPPCLPSFVPLHDLHSGLLLAAAATLSPFMISILGCSCLPLPPCLPSFVSLHDLHSGLLLAAAAVLSPSLVSLHDRICLVPFLFCFFWQFGWVDAIWGLCRCNYQPGPSKGCLLKAFR